MPDAPLDHTAEHIGVIAVDVEPFTRCETKEKRREPLHGFANRLALVCGASPMPGWRSRGPSPWSSAANVAVGAVGNARRVRQQIANRESDAWREPQALLDSPFGFGHRRRRERRDEPAHRIGDAELSVLHQHQNRGAGKGLRLRRDAEDSCRSSSSCRLPCRSIPLPARKWAFPSCSTRATSAGNAVIVNVLLKRRVDARDAELKSTGVSPALEQR